MKPSWANAGQHANEQSRMPSVSGFLNQAAVRVGYSKSRVCTEVFAACIVNSIATAVPEYEGAVMRLTAYTPPGMSDYGEGFIEIVLLRSPYVEDESAAFGIYFGQFGESRADVQRSTFDVESWRECRRDPGAAGIQAANWEEAWLIACMLGERMRVSRIQFCYGA